MKGQNRIHIGTSGWHYEDWKGPFYPEETGSGEMLGFYSRHFGVVEINNTFYQLPAAETLETWRYTVPESFRFAVKASRYLTHMKKLKDPEGPLRKLLERVETLGPRLGPILFQLPPRWRCNLERLEEFLRQLPEEHRYAFEFRDQGWFNHEVYRLLRRTGKAFCIYELAGTRSPREVTADFVYVRLHGPSGAYQGSYDPESLAGWAGAASGWAGQGRDVFIFFDNDQHGNAARNALRLRDMVAGGD